MIFALLSTRPPSTRRTGEGEYDEQRRKRGEIHKVQTKENLRLSSSHLCNTSAGTGGQNAASSTSPFLVLMTNLIFALLFIRPPANRETGELEGLYHGS
jgi:hypothetical protein